MSTITKSIPVSIEAEGKYCGEKFMYTESFHGGASTLTHAEMKFCNFFRHISDFDRSKYDQKIISGFAGGCFLHAKFGCVPLKLDGKRALRCPQCLAEFGE